LIRLSAAMFRSHGSIGGRDVLHDVDRRRGVRHVDLSNFTPSLYFGVLTVVAMIAAVAGRTVITAQVDLIFRPFGPGR